MAAYKIIDADAHMCEPPSMWAERVDKRFRDRAPRLVVNPNGKKGSFIALENFPPMRFAGAFAAGKTFDANTMNEGIESVPLGAYQPAARLKDMELDGVEATILYTTFGFMLYWLEDAALQEACFRAYNDWLAEFCSYAPNKLGGLALISLFDPERGRRELERCKKLGLKGAMIWASPPEDQPYHSPIYDSFWAAAQDLEMPLSLHLLTGRGKDSQQDESNLAEMYVRMIVRTHEIQRSLLVMIFSGVLDRFPRLKLVSAENDIAWVPHLFERANKYYRRMKQAFQVPISLTPDEYFKRQIYVTFIDDPVGLKTYQLVGADNIMWSTDYPHQAATWPHSQEVMARDFKGIPDADVRKMVRENTAKLYGFAL